MKKCEFYLINKVNKDVYKFYKINTTLNSSEYDYIFCFDGINNKFSLNKIIILDTINDKERDTIKDLNIIIGFGYSNSEIIKNNYIFIKS